MNRATCSPTCDHSYRRMYISTFLPLWVATMTFCTAILLETSWTGAMAAFVVACSLYPAGDLYETLRDRLPRRMKDNPERGWMIRFVLYMVLVPLFPMATLYALQALGTPGLEIAAAKSFYTCGGGLAMFFGFFRCCKMPMSLWTITAPLWHERVGLSKD